MRANKAKLKDLILYILQRYNNEKLTETKLQKLLYYCDFNYFEVNKNSITGFTYKKNNFGPTIMDLPSILNEMEAEGLIATIAGQNYYGGPQKRFSVKSNILPTDTFSESERLTINEVNDAYKELTPREISNLSHADFPYAATPNMGDVIKYELVNFREDAEDNTDLEDKELRELFTSAPFHHLMEKVNTKLTN